MSWLNLSRPEVLFAFGAVCLLGIAAFALIASETLGTASVDLLFHDTYVVISWVHVPLLAAMLFGMFAALYRWVAKFVGHSMSCPLGRMHFWLTFLSASGVMLLTIWQWRLAAARAGSHAPTRIEIGLLLSVLLGLFGQAIFLINLCWTLFKRSLD